MVLNDNLLKLIESKTKKSINELQAMTIHDRRQEEFAKSRPRWWKDHFDRVEHAKNTIAAGAVISSVLILLVLCAFVWP